jgi:hypothetical protein
MEGEDFFALYDDDDAITMLCFRILSRCVGIIGYGFFGHSPGFIRMSINIKNDD